MSAKKIQFSLEFNADTKKAEQQIQKLQHALDSAISSSTQGKDLGLTPRLEEARKSAMQLKIALNNAMNVDTGKLNLRKFSKELSSTGLSVQQLANHMKRLGPEGVEAFNQMANAIAAADTKLFSLQGGMKRLANTFMNTVRYQASAAAINAMTSAITNAISYTKELDKSLTDIMMVTEYSREEMNSFAVAANKAAKALSISTNAYAKASLIYFQQGYDIGEAMKRAETTIRLAHATGESAQEVSEWMTAIWNNFDNGTKALEYYGDVLAKLGAKTASSADEIAQGLSKFAAVAETVGLSYEYAASALATLTAETRQSADVVGTALKTLFSRMEQLQLGETLDDGTTLGKYSLALQSVGVDIKDTNGQLKDMDQILDETAAKWSVLSKDQQVALAQSVAGVRQYTQFIALMDNYDIMQSNLELSKEASGSLKEMQNEYKNSIEGIKEESKAAGESLSDALLDEDDIKTFYKAVTKITEFVTELVDAFGGLEGILLTVSSLLMKTYQSKLGGFFSSGITAIQDFRVHIGNALQDAKHFKHNVTDFFQTGGQNQQHETKKLTSAEQTRLQIIQQRSTMQAAQSGGMASSTMAGKIAAAEMDLQMRSKDLTEAQKQQYSWQIKVLEAIKDELVLREQKLDKIEEESIGLETQVELAYNANKVNQQAIERAKQQPKPQSSGLAAASDLANAYTTDDKVIQARNQHTSSAGIRQQYGKAMAEQLEVAKEEAKALGIEISDLDFEGAEQSLQAFVNKGGKNLDELIKKLNELQTKIGEKAAPAPVPLVTDIDTSYVATRSARVGTMTAGIDRAVSKAEGIKGVQLKSQEREVIGQQITSALETSKKKAQELGLNIKDLGFENVTDDIALFVEKGNSHLNQLLQKLKDIQSAVKKAGATTMSQTVDDALLGTQNASIASMNTLEHAPNQQFDNVASSLEQLSSAKDISLSDSDKAFLQTSQKVAKALQQQQKMLQNKQKIMKKLVASGKTETEAEAAYGKMVQQNQKHINKFNKSVSKRVQTIKKSNSALGEQVKLTQGYEEVSEGARQATEQFAQAQKQGAEESYNVTTTLQEVSEGFDNFQGKANKVSLGDMFSGFMTGAMQVMSGFSMLQNGVAQLTEAFNDGEAGFDDYLSGIMAIIPGLTNMIAPIAKVMRAILAKAAASRAAALQEQKNANIEQAAEAKKQKGKIATAMANIAEQFTRGPAGWVIAAVGIAALAAIGIGMAVSAGAKQGQEKQQEAELETNREVNAAAGEVSKTLTGLSEQVDTFKNLRERGESTIDVLKDMEGAIEDVKFQISELISKAGSKTQWKFLEGATSALDIAYKDFSDGIITADEFQSRVDNITKRVNQTATKTALNTMRASGSKEDLNAYLTQVGTTVTGSDDLMKQAEKEFLDGTYESAEDAEKAWANAAIDAALGPQYAHEDWAESDTAIASLLSYAPTSVHRVIEGLRMFAPDGAIANKYGEGTAKKAQAWAGRNQSKLAYANNIDFSTGSEDDWNQQYLAEMDKAKEAELVMEADKLGYDEETFETYVDLLVDVNEHLDENDKISKQLAVNNLKLNQSLKELAGSWGDIADVIKSGERDTIEYAQAVGKVKSAFKDAFGYAPSTEFIEQNFGLIDELINGNVEALEALQTEIATDMVMNMEYKTAINGVSKSPEEIQNILLGLLSQLDDNMDLEIGQNATISDDYLNSLQAMLDSGQMTADELDTLMRAKGFEIEYDGWKDLPGPKSRITQTITPSNGEPYTQTIESEETLQVPIINGQVPQGITTAGNPKSKAKIVRASNDSTIRASTFGKDGKNKEIERYHEIKEVLSDVERQMNKISKAKDRAFGQAKLSLMDQEIAKQNDLIEAEKEYLRQIKEKYNEDLAALDSRFELDDEGRIKNYTKTLEELQKTYGPEKYEELKDAADQYEKTLNELEAQQDAVNDRINEAADLALERIEYNVEIKVHFNDRDIKHFNFLLEKLDDPLQDVAEAIALIGKTAASNLGNIDAYIRGIEEILGQSFSDSQSKAFQNLLANMPSAEDLPSALSEILGDAEFTDDQVTALEKYVDSLYDTSGALDDFYTQVMEQVNGAFDDMNEKSEKAISRTEQLGATLQTYQNIIDLVGKKALGVTNEQIRALGRAQIAQAKATLETKQGQLEMNRTALAAAEAKKKAAEASGDSEAIKYWEEQIETIQDKVWTLEGEVETAWSDTLQSIADDFQNAVDTATSAFEESMTGIYGSYEKMQEAFDQQQEISDRYVEDYKKIYELSKLNRDLNKSIDSTDSIKGKQALRDLQEEINALQESDAEMSEYDLEYLRKKYELRVAEIALEEAQNAKSQVRMQRDAEGNWGYVYTADEAKIDSSQQNYEDKLHAMQEFNQTYMDEVQSAIIQTEADMLAAIEQLHEEDYASQEEYFKAVDAVRKYYTDKRNYYFSELQKSIGNNKTLYNEDWQSYSDNTGYKISKAGEWKDSFEETEYALVTKYSDIETAQRTFTDNSKKLVDELTGAYDQWQKDVSEAFDLVGKDFENFAKQGGELDQRTKEVEGKLATVTSEFNSWKPTAEGAFQGIIDAAEDKFTDFSSKINDYQNKIKNVTDALREMLRLAGEKIPDKQLNTDTDGVKGNTNGGSTVPSTIPPKTPTTTTPNYYKTKTYSLKGEKINDRTQEVLEKGAFKFTKEELASAKRSTPWSSYFDIIKDGYTYSIAENDYLQALTESGQSDLYKAAEKNPFTTANTSPDNKPPWGVGDTVTFNKGALTGAPFEFKNKRGRAGDDITYSDVGGYKFTIVHNYDQYGWVGTTDLPINGWPYFYIWKTDLERLDGYDTGGYTGSWDSSGRLAMLHQKEIVLNAQDTENFLAAINIVRDIASAIDLRAAAQQSALSQITAASVSPMTQTLEQEVTIHAEFPNATQRTEIEAAFDTLLNRASQFANRKNK